MSHIFQTTTDGVSIDRRLLDTGAKVVVSTRDRKKIAATAVADELTDLGPGVLFTTAAALSGATAADVELATITPGFPGKVVAAFAVVHTVTTTAGRDADVRVDIAGTSVDGGDIALTSANTDGAVGDVVSGALVLDTPAAEFGATDDIQFDVSALPAAAFLEGSVMFAVLVAPIRKDGAAAL